MGHSLQGKLASRVEEQVELLLERIEILLESGWREIRVVTDHGWLWLPGGLPKIDLPKYLTVSRWARCAAIKGGSKVEVPTVRWHWNAHERVAVAPGIACFSAGNEYAHGGLSLQESPYPGHPGHCRQSGWQGNGRDRGSQLGRLALPRSGRGHSAGPVGRPAHKGERCRLFGEPGARARRKGRREPPGCG